MNTRRRTILRFAAATVMAIPAASLLSGAAAASDLPKLAEDDATALALGYVKNAGDVDASRWTRFEDGQKCGNCNLLQGGDGEWRACPIFPGKAVNVAGWCSAWITRAA